MFLFGDFHLKVIAQFHDFQHPFLPTTGTRVHGGVVVVHPQQAVMVHAQQQPQYAMYPQYAVQANPQHVGVYGGVQPQVMHNLAHASF